MIKIRLVMYLFFLYIWRIVQIWMRPLFSINFTYILHSIVWYWKQAFPILNGYWAYSTCYLFWSNALRLTKWIITRHRRYWLFVFYWIFLPTIIDRWTRFNCSFGNWNTARHLTTEQKNLLCLSNCEHVRLWACAQHPVLSFASFQFAWDTVKYAFKTRTKEKINDQKSVQFYLSLFFFSNADFSFTTTNVSSYIFLLLTLSRTN